MISFKFAYSELYLQIISIDPNSHLKKHFDMGIPWIFFLEKNTSTWAFRKSIQRQLDSSSQVMKFPHSVQSWYLAAAELAPSGHRPIAQAIFFAWNDVLKTCCCTKIMYAYVL